MYAVHTPLSANPSPCGQIRQSRTDDETAPNPEGWGRCSRAAELNRHSERRVVGSRVMGEQSLRVALPAICRQCGAVFESSFVVAGHAQVTMSGCTSGPCPSCGGLGDVPDGLWTLVPRVLRLAREARPTLNDLTRLRALVDEQMRSTIDLDVLRARAEREAPSAAALLGVARDPATQSVLALLALLVGIAALIVAMRAPEGEPVQYPEHQQHGSQGGERTADAQHDKPRHHEGGEK